jgi:hypothetical protein
MSGRRRLMRGLGYNIETGIAGPTPFPAQLSHAVSRLGGGWDSANVRRLGVCLTCLSSLT